MPTKNFVTDFGGVGDGQRQHVNVTIGSGSPNLAVGTAIFASGDVGKAIALWSDDGSVFLQTTIKTFTDSQHVVLNANSPGALSAAPTDILWGTDNTNALTGATSSWRAYAQGQTNTADPPVLLVPDGNYCAAWDGNGLKYQVLNHMRVSGISGVAANCRFMMLANAEQRYGAEPAIVPNRGLTNSGGNSARLQTFSKGTSSIFLVDPTNYGARVTVGNACLIAGYDLQGGYQSAFGYPPNSQFVAWRTITAYNSSTGEISLDAPLPEGMESTWPEWGLESTLFGSDQGGPATIWIAPSDWNYTTTLENFTVDSPHNQSSCHCRNVVCNNLLMNSPGLYPTQCDTFTATNCVYPQELEVDKMVGTCTWNNCTLNRLIQQSTSPQLMVVNGGSIDSLDTARHTQANNVTFTGSATVRVGCFAYGRTDRIELNNCTGIATFAEGGVTTDDLGANASDFFTWVGGKLSFVKSTSVPGASNFTRFCPPGTWVAFDFKYMDQVVDVSDDGTNIYIQFANTTNWPFTPVSKLDTHPCPDFTMSGCSGAAPEFQTLTNAPSRIPFYSYFNKNFGGSSSDVVFPHASEWPGVFGKQKSIVIDVQTPYTGSHSNLFFHFSEFDNLGFIKSDFSSVSWGFAVNARIAGKRIILPTDNVSNGTAQSGDGNLLVPSGGLWFPMVKIAPCYQVGANASTVVDISGESPSVWPVINVQLNLDQGIPPIVPSAVAPLRLRLHA